MLFLCVCFQATDPDLGASGQVNYRLVNHQKLFSINATGAITTMTPLDREVSERIDMFRFHMTKKVAKIKIQNQLFTVVLMFDRDSP